MKKEEQKVQTSQSSFANDNNLPMINNQDYDYLVWILLAFNGMLLIIIAYLVHKIKSYSIDKK